MGKLASTPTQETPSGYACCAATFWAEDSVVLAELKPLDGFMDPGGAKYRFKCSEDSVLYRFAAS